MASGLQALTDSTKSQCALLCWSVLTCYVCLLSGLGCWRTVDCCLCRSARSFRALMDSQRGKTVFIVSTRALKELEDRFFKHLSLEMSWSDAPHEVRI